MSQPISVDTKNVQYVILYYNLLIFIKNTIIHVARTMHLYNKSPIYKHI